MYGSASVPAPVITGGGLGSYQVHNSENVSIGVSTTTIEAFSPGARTKNLETARKNVNRM